VACCPNCQEEHTPRSRDCPSRSKSCQDAQKVLSRQTHDSMDLAEDQNGRSTVVPAAPGPPPKTWSAPLLPHNSPPPGQRAHHTITDLAPGESGDESLYSDSSEGSAQSWRILSLDTQTAGRSSRPFLSSNLTALRAGMLFFHSFTASLCWPTLPCLLQFKTPLPDNRCSQSFKDFSPCNGGTL